MTKRLLLLLLAIGALGAGAGALIVAILELQHVLG